MAPDVEAALSDAPKPRLIFIKTYKTGSTTVAMFLNTVGYQKVLRSVDKRHETSNQNHMLSNDVKPLSLTQTHEHVLSNDV